MLASASRLSVLVDVELELGIWLYTKAELLVDVELVLGIICEDCGVASMASTICSCIRSTT